MAADKEFDRRQLIEAVLARKLEEHFEWTHPEYQRTVGPINRDAYKEYSELRSDLIDAIRSRLESLKDDDLRDFFTANGLAKNEFRDEWRPYFSENIRKLAEVKPHWVEAGFGHPDYAADFDYWGKMPRFELHEALCLSIGIEPKHFDPKRIQNLKEIKDGLPESLEFFLRRHEQFRRQFSPHGHHWTVKPRELLEWIERVELDVHPLFKDVLQRFHGLLDTPEADEKATERNIESFSQKEKVSMAKLITAMAIDHYGYDPKALKSPIPKEIENIADLIGLSVSNDTIRKYLKLGARFLPDDFSTE